MENLDTIFQSFEIGIRSTKATKPREYLNSIGLDFNDIRIGFNSGQFYHRKDVKSKEIYLQLGLLSKSKSKVNSEYTCSYTAFGKYGIIFPLLNKNRQIVNLFAIRFDLNKPTTSYLNKQGIYPCFPSPLSKKLYIVKTITDCASLLQSRTLENRDAVIALHEGQILPQHIEAINSLYNLEEIILINN
ncbi:MAG: hypothetical protein RLZZ323_1147 [Bacteroidota bacterium]|jgi:hypothetical protein